MTKRRKGNPSPQPKLDDDYWIDDYFSLPGMTVHTEEEELFSGLYDADGNPLYKEKIKMGFDLE